MRFRALVLATAILATGAAASAPPAQAEGVDLPEDRVFRVTREDRVLGTHAIRFDERGGDLVVDVDIDLKLTFGPFTLYRYDHDATEVWRNGALWAGTATTDNNGDDWAVDAERVGNSLFVRGTEDGERFRFTHPADLLPSSYWRRDILDQARMFNTQKGEIQEIEITAMGTETIETYRGPVEAEKFRLRGSLDLYLWYAGPDLVSMGFYTRGAHIRYALIDPASPEAVAAHAE